MYLYQIMFKAVCQKAQKCLFCPSRAEALRLRLYYRIVLPTIVERPRKCLCDFVRIHNCDADIDRLLGASVEVTTALDASGGGFY